MKKMISLLLTLILTMQTLSCIVFAWPQDIDDESEAASASESAEPQLGKLYSAVWDYSAYDNVLLCKESEEEGYLIEMEDFVDKADLPQSLTVKLMLEGDYYLYVTNDDWPAEYDEYRYVDSADLIILEEVLPSDPGDGYIYGRVSVTCDKAIGNTVTLPFGDKAYAMTELGFAVSEGAAYQWQIKLSDGRWATIADYIYPYAVLSEALLTGDRLSSGTAALRCIVTDGTAEYASNEIKLKMQTETLSSLSSKMAGQGDDGSEPSTISSDAFQIVVKYTYRHASAVQVPSLDGTSAAHTFTITYPYGSGGYSGEISSPPLAGYLPYVTEENKGLITEENPRTLTYEGTEYFLASSLTLSGVNEPKVIEVFYIPQKVDYRIKIYEQNLKDDNYLLVETKVVSSRLADSAVGDDLAAERVGFTPLYYDPQLPINGDGSTVVEIYYDRNYYLVDFDLAAADAYGAIPYYVRYGSQLVLPSPTRPGYAFDQWTLDEVYTLRDEDKTPVTDPAILSAYDQKDAGKLITVRHNLHYTASWTTSDASYTIVYWLENADSTDASLKGNYDVWYTYRVTNAKTGTQTIGGADNIKAYVTARNGFETEAVNDVQSTYPYLLYRESLTDTQEKTVLGDGTTAINIYYARKQYTLKFYYALEKTLESNGYYVIGGTTYGFGNESKGPTAGLRRYVETNGENKSDIGKITALPTLNEKGQSRPYTNTYDTDGNFRYYYLSFSAKYGADLTDLWPCGVFNPTTRTSANTHGKWSGKTAFVSAWNGEYNVKYTVDQRALGNNGNQTIKGNYTQLDENLLWADTSKAETTVSYVCFWENGADIGWSVPKLFRYNIYLPLLAGQDTTDLTVTDYKNNQYYLYTSYDTVDDSTPEKQTQPALVGFKAIGRGNDIINSYDTTLYTDAYEMFFYYSRDTYTITFNDMHGNPKDESVLFGTDLGQSKYKDRVPSYPTALEDNEFVFDKWYIDEAYQNEFIFDGATMPAKSIQLYAKWNKLSYTSRIYFDAEKTILLAEETALFGSAIVEPDYKALQQGNEAYKNLIFAGWYYVTDGEEKRFDFKTMVLKADIEIYAKWTSTVPVPYTIRYVIQSGDEYIDIADPTEGVSLANLTKSFVAKTGEELYSSYRSGYFPNVHSHSVTMSNEQENEYLFVYSQPSSITYTITHQFVSDEFVDILGTRKLTLTLSTTLSGAALDAMPAVERINFLTGIDQSRVLAAAESVAGTLSQSEKDEIWHLVTQMSPDSFEQEIIFTAESSPNITFNWIGRDVVSMYQVVHYLQTVDGTGYVVGYTEDFMANIGESVTAVPDGHLVGFAVNAGHASTKLSGTVSKISFNDENSGLVLRIYYDRVILNFAVRHYQQGTTTSLYNDTGVHQVRYGSKVYVSDLAKNIEGYTLVNGDESVEIVSEGQPVTCNYKGLDVFYRYQTDGDGGYFSSPTDDTVVGTAPNATTLQLMSGYVLDGWYYTVDGGDPQKVPSAWLSNENMTVQPLVPEAEWANKTIYVYASVVPTALEINQNVFGQAIVYRITGKAGTPTANVSIRVAANDQQAVFCLPVGEYTVHYESAWSWQYTPQSGVGSQEITLSGKETAIFFYYDLTDRTYVVDNAYFDSQAQN